MPDARYLDDSDSPRALWRAYGTDHGSEWCLGGWSGATSDGFAVALVDRHEDIDTFTGVTIERCLSRQAVEDLRAESIDYGDTIQRDICRRALDKGGSIEAGTSAWVACWHAIADARAREEEA